MENVFACQQTIVENLPFVGEKNLETLGIKLGYDSEFTDTLGGMNYSSYKKKHKSESCIINNLKMCRTKGRNPFKTIQDIASCLVVKDLIAEEFNKSEHVSVDKYSDTDMDIKKHVEVTPDFVFNFKNGQSVNVKLLVTTKPVKNKYSFYGDKYVMYAKNNTVVVVMNPLEMKYNIIDTANNANIVSPVFDWNTKCPIIGAYCVNTKSQEFSWEKLDNVLFEMYMTRNK